MKKKPNLNWPQIEKTLRDLNLKVFTTLELKKVLKIKSMQTLYSLLQRYRKKKLIIQLSRGLYALANVSSPDLYIANRLYKPSYVSFETALSYHNIIPETVYSISSATTKSTRRIQAEAIGKVFNYHKIKRQTFTGYFPVTISGNVALLADPEKAMVDYLYLVTRGIKKPLGRVYNQRLNKAKLVSYASLFHNTKLIQLVREL